MEVSLKFQTPSAWRPEKETRCQSIGAYVGPRAGMYFLQNRNSPTPTGIRTSGRPVCRPGHYTNYIISAHLFATAYLRNMYFSLPKRSCQIANLKSYLKIYKSQIR